MGSRLALLSSWVALLGSAISLLSGVVLGVEEGDGEGVLRELVC